ncbi:FAD dependent oxidoreductase [Roridomyces roridus]|uniref:FAD dependent oxidoreductase n=1 Tax=Roridomyces roridus TaxID=1738132 RepID=A0AAD7FM62_9AGAR|nr:FAD dependent oxidoreductase [Roridomyces roridus]
MRSLPYASLGLLALASYAHAENATTTYATICKQIQYAVSSASTVYFPGDAQYVEDINHWALSSIQDAACSVEPGTAGDVATIIKIVGSTRTPFAVKGGGHTSNPGFSSTRGVQISMNRFSNVTYDAASGTATIGMGLVWDDVYAALEPHGVNVVGGRSSGVGVAGFSLGGGYSWKTNQFGLTLDSITEFELIKPNGEIVQVNAQSDADLFFGLRGIVTHITMKTHPQSQVWGGFMIYTVDQSPAVISAIAAFCANVTDPKAAMINTVSYTMNTTLLISLIFYDEPNQPVGIFDDFLKIPVLEANVSTQSFLSLVQGTPSQPAARAYFDTFWGTALTPSSGTFISYAIEPFLPTLYTHGSNSAYPPERVNPGYSPLNLYYAWTDSAFDGIINQTIKESSARLTSLAEAEGQNIQGAALYPNYALAGTPLEKLYGGNLGRLREIRERVDPGGAMGLAGGWRF